MSRKLYQILFLSFLTLITSACSGTTKADIATPTVLAVQPTDIDATSIMDDPTPTVFVEQATSVESTPLVTVTEELPESQLIGIPRPFSPASGGILISDNNDLFATAGICVDCHQNNVDEAGNDVSLGEYWRSTMMANAAKDPYYLAGVSINVARYPEYSEAIEAKCSTCHTPMAHFSDVAKDEQGALFGSEGYLDPQHPNHTLALDGVSCTTCHQIQNEGLGEFTSFSGGEVFDMQTPLGNRAIFGPFVPQRSGQRIMSGGSGFVPQQGTHLLQSEICATCHNLYTHYVTEDGTFSEDWFPEQTPYSEWLNSDYATQSTCQDCHMPPAVGGVVLANQGPAIMREPFAKHTFVGGNVYMLDVLKNFGGELGVQADAEHFDATSARTLTQLQSQTAALAITDPVLADTMLSFDVTTNVLTGHKFPTGYPSRRAWLHVTVKDANGQIVFESGSVSDNGAISGNDNDANALVFEPHYDEITSPEQVQIYETIMQDVYGDVTTILLSASAYSKDNRLLPAGFDKTAVTPDIIPQGEALTDDDFVDGVDTVTYHVDAGSATGPFTVEVELLYQTIAFRWAQDVSTHNTEQAQRFSAYYNTLPNLPVVVTAQSVQSE